MVASAAPQPFPVVLYDGECGLCHASVRWLLKQDRHARLRFAALRSHTATRLLSARPALAGGLPDSILFLDTDPRRPPLARSDAALAIAAHLPAPWSWLRFLRVLPRRLRDTLYDAIARRRHRWGKPDSGCLLPTAANRARFLED